MLTLAFLFTLLAFVQLSLVRGEFSPEMALAPVLLLVCGGGTVYLLPRPRASDARVLLGLTFLLSGLGLAMIARLAPAFLTRQMIWLVLATLILILSNRLPHVLTLLRQYKYLWLIGGLTLLATTLIIGVNPSGYGARLWLQVGAVYFQPSETLKLFLVVFLAAYMADRHRQLTHERAYIGTIAVPHPSYWGPLLTMWGLSIILLIWQRDLGAAFLFFGTFLSMVYVVTGQIRYVVVGVGLLLTASIIGYNLFDVVRLRFEAYLNPWLDPAGRSFQIVQSLLAFASGGIFGQGLGQGLPTAIPVVHTDFVYAAIGEEYGLMGAVAVLGCFVLLVSRAFHIGLRATTRFEQLLATGIGTMLGLQTLVITAGTLKLMPLTGVTLPLVSYGGSSLITSFAMLGLLMRMSHKQNNQPPRQAQATSGEPVEPIAPFAPYQLRLLSGLLTAFLVVAGGLILWQVALQGFLLNRNDNPRPVIEAQRIARGSIYAADGTPLVETELDANGFAIRRYHYPDLAPMVGYYSQRYGVGGAEATFDRRLRGSLDLTPEQQYLDDLLHRRQIGQPITLTVDLPTQLAADSALSQHEGAIVVLDIATSGVIALSSRPTYDPNQLDEQWDSLRQDERAPLLNRASQGLFAVGDLASLLGLIGLREAGSTIPPDPLTVSAVDLLKPLGVTGFEATVHQLGLRRRLRYFDSQTSQLPNFSSEGTVQDLTVTPLHLARIIAALELDGHLPQPRLSELSERLPSRGFSPTTAAFVRQQLPAITPQLIGLTAQATPEETGQPHYLSWFVGLAPTQPLTDTLGPRPTPDLIFDPSLITPTVQATPSPRSPESRARYAIVVVVITPTPSDTVAQRIALTTLQPLLPE